MYRAPILQSRRLARSLLAVGLATVLGVTTAGVASAAAKDRSTLTYRGVTVDVPEGWPVVDLAADPSRCLLLTEEVVYLGNPGADQRCAAPRIGQRRAIWVAVDRTGRGVRTGQTVGDVTTADAASRSGSDPDATTPVPGPSAADAGEEPTSRFTGMGLDTCTAPSLATMKAWLASPYRVAGIYLGGINRACGDGNLSAAWVDSVVQSGWGLLPIYVGLQAPCVQMSGVAKIDPAQASSQGTAAATDAVAQAARFGLGAGTTIFLDIENYTPSASCTETVLAFVSAWTAELRRVGYLSGVYGNPPSLMTDLSNARTAGRTDVAYPDTIWYAHWNGLQTVSAQAQYPAFKDAYWSGARVHQYRGDYTETWNGVTQAMDANWVDATLPGRAAAVSYGTDVTGPGGEGFVFTGDMRYWRPAGPAGLTGMAHWTNTSGATEYNGATWTGPATTAPRAVAAYVPPGVATGTAVYTIRHATGTTTLRKDQSTPGWIELGTFAGTTQSPIQVHLGDNANAASSEPIVADAMRFMSTALPPTAPGSPTAVADDASALVTWTPSEERGSPISGYTVTASSGRTITVAAQSVSATVTGLTNGTPVTFTVTAKSAAGNTTSASSPAVVPTPPDASFPRDVTGDGALDVLAVVRDSGALRLYPTTGNGSWSPRREVFPSGWGGHRMVLTAGNWDADRISDLLTISSTGQLRLWSGRGDGSFADSRAIGTGWHIFDQVFPVGDLDGDRHPDLAARKSSDGTLWLYRGNGYGGFLSWTRIGTGWQIFDVILGGGDFNGNGTTDLLARTKEGTLRFYDGSGTGRLRTGRQVGTGWQHFTALVSAGDFTGDGHNDLLARTTTGVLYVYPGDGGGRWLPRRKIGTGWHIFSRMLL